MKRANFPGRVKIRRVSALPEKYQMVNRSEGVGRAIPTSLQLEIANLEAKIAKPVYLKNGIRV